MKIIGLQFAKRIALTVAVTLMVACAWIAPLESAANQVVDAGLKRSLVTFAAARSINAVVSVIQGTDILIEPEVFGVKVGGTKLALGQFFKPLNDMVEQFAHLMLIASVAFGVERMLMTIGSFWLVSLLLTATAIGWSYFYLRQQASPPWLTKILVMLLMTRFAMPLVIIGSDMLFHQFMAADYQSSQQVIETVPGHLEKLSSPEAVDTNQPSMIDKLKGWGLKSASDIKSWLQKNVEQAAEKAIVHMIKLMVIFLLQTLVIPLFLLWALWGLAKGTFEVPLQEYRFAIPSKRDEN